MALTVLSGEGRIVRHELVDRIHARTISKTAGDDDAGDRG
jgi:hypothetical protein